MARYDKLMDEYLNERGINSSQTLLRTITAVRGTAARKNKVQRWLRQGATAGGMLSAALLLLAWRLWEHNQFANAGAVESLGFSHGTRQTSFQLSLYSGIMVAGLTLAAWLTILVQRWQKARRLGRVETSLPDPEQVLRQVRHVK